MDCWLFNQIHRSKFSLIYHLIFSCCFMNLDWNKRQVEIQLLSHFSWCKCQWFKYSFLNPASTLWDRFFFSKCVSKVSMFLRVENIPGILKQCRHLSELRLPKVLVKCTNPHSLHVEVVVKLSKLWSESKNILWVSYCCKGSQILEVTMFPATLNTKKPFLFCINYFGKVISSEMFLQERNIDSWILNKYFSITENHWDISFVEHVSLFYQNVR